MLSHSSPFQDNYNLAHTLLYESQERDNPLDKEDLERDSKNYNITNLNDQGDKMRYLMSIIMVLFLVSPAVADSYCSITGPHNCNEQIDNMLSASTRSAANRVEATSPQHAFPTENDEILARAAQEQANNNLNTNSDYAFLAR